MIRCQTCPVCASEPVIDSPNLTPWFCSNADCDVLAWDPYSTLEQNLLDARPADVTERRPDDAGTNQT